MKIDEIANRNLKAVSTNQIMNIQNFCRDRNDEMKMLSNYALIQDDAIAEMAGKLLGALNADYISPITGSHMPIPCSIGIATSGNVTVDYKAFVKKADEAMYTAKENGKNTVHIMDF